MGSVSPIKTGGTRTGRSMFRVHRLTAGAVTLAAMLLSAGPVLAADVQASASYNGGVWSISAPTNAGACAGVLIGLHSPGAISLVVDGVTYSGNASVISHGNPMFIELYSGVPSGSLSSITFFGQSSIVCGPDRVLLPSNMAPAPIPTMTDWAMILFGVLLAGAAALTIHRRRTA